MRVTDLPTYQSPWLTAADLQGRPRRLAITEWTFEDVRSREGAVVRKVALSFHGAKKRLLLNTTQAKALDAGFGELEQWIGKQVILQPALTPGGQQTIHVVTLPAPGVGQPKEDAHAESSKDDAGKGA